METLQHILSTYNSISLEETKSRAELITRFDEKYIIPTRLLENILLACRKDYDVLEITGKKTPEL